MGVPIDKLTDRQAIERIDRFVRSGRPHQIVTVNAEFLVAAQHDHAFREILHQSSLNTADGIGVLWAAYFLSLPPVRTKFFRGLITGWQLLSSALAVVFSPGRIRSAIPEKISGTDLIWSVARQAERQGYSIFLLGGFGDVAEKTAKKLQQRFPGLKIAGSYAGSPTEEGIVERVNKSGADILLVAFGPVRQELWISQNLKKLTASVCMGLGGTFDYMAGNKALAPNFLRYRGLEWAWRLITQPKRLLRIVNAVPIFCQMVYRAKLSQHRPFRQNVVGCLVDGQGQILICRRKDPEPHFGTGEHWQLPQGGVQEGETLDAAFKREILEETGVNNPEVLGDLPEAYHYDWPAELADEIYSNKYRGQTQSIFYARVGRDQTIKLDDREFDAYRWVKKEDLLSAIHTFRQDLARLVIENFDRFVK